MSSTANTVHESAMMVLLDQARALMAEQQWGAAERRYLEVLEIEPTQLDALRGLGLVALQSNQDQRALEWLQRAHQIAPTNTGILGHLGVAFRRNGRLGEAISAFENALSSEPENHSIIVNLARALRDSGRIRDAVAAFERAARLAPNPTQPLSMLSNARRELGDLAGASCAAEDALRIDPLFFEAHVNRAAALYALERFTEATVSFFCAFALEPGDASAGTGLRLAFRAASIHSTARDADVLAWIRTLTSPTADAVTCLALADWEQARDRHENALVCREHSLRFAETTSTLRDCARLLWGFGLRERAKLRLRRAIQLDETDLQSHRLLANWAMLERDHATAEAHLRKVVRAAPTEVEAHVNLATALMRQARPSEALGLLERARDLDPEAIEVTINLGLALCDLGRFSEARSVYEKGLARLEHRVLRSNWLFSMHYDPTCSPEQIFDAHVLVARKLEASVKAPVVQHVWDRNVERQLRVGFVSPDFRLHPVAFLLEPYLREHDSQAFRLYGYSDVAAPDATTARLGRLFHDFRSCTSLTDEALAAQVRADEIDILFDLAGHTAHNRLPAFALRPCPIQVAWLGYFNTTGLSTIDYRIADSQSAPEGIERYFVERVVRLPRTSNCYLPPVEIPVGLSDRSPIGFGCFNNPAKITREVVACFAQILREVPESRLILKYGLFSDPGLRSQYIDWFCREGVAETRLELRSHSSLEHYFDEFADVDVALDPFPYSGETTALHTLWMGVPLVAMEGRTLVQRLASRVLRIAGFDNWVADSTEQYVRVAVSLAKTRLDLQQRQGIREKLRRSPLMDYPGFARDFEAALRSLWRSHGESSCDRAGTS